MRERHAAFCAAISSFTRAHVYMARRTLPCKAKADQTSRVGGGGVGLAAATELALPGMPAAATRSTMARMHRESASSKCGGSNGGMDGRQHGKAPACCGGSGGGADKGVEAATRGDGGDATSRRPGLLSVTVTSTTGVEGPAARAIAVAVAFSEAPIWLLVPESRLRISAFC